MRSTLLTLALLLSLGCGASGGTPAPHSPSSSSPTEGAAGGNDGQAPAPDSQADWEKIRDEDGIVVFRKEVEDSPVVAFRGEGEIQAPLGRVALIQMNMERASEWIDRMKEARVLEARTEEEFLTYSHIGAPPLVSDRDFVNQVRIEYDPPRRIKFNIHSVEDPKAPPTAGVRGKLLHSSFEFTAVAPDRTRVVCEIHADPMGSLPKWVVNQFQKGWAFRTISQMRKQAQKSDLAERAPQIRDLLQRRGFSL